MRNQRRLLTSSSSFSRFLRPAVALAAACGPVSDPDLTPTIDLGVSSRPPPPNSPPGLPRPPLLPPAPGVGEGASSVPAVADAADAPFFFFSSSFPSSFSSAASTAETVCSERVCAQRVLHSFVIFFRM